ncbi:MAG TPA: hypothetical protein VMF56_15250 [Acidobacteriaceae bacterium]|nr:hypothetical protein [Acidobacteriaceae bacterium]
MMTALACAAFVGWWKLKPVTREKDVVVKPIADVIPPQVEKETYL